MANAIPVNSTPAEKKDDKPRKDVRRPDLLPEVGGKDKPKNTYKMGDTVIEDF